MTTTNFAGKSLSELLAILTDAARNREQRIKAAVALGQIGDSSVVPDLVAALTDREDELRRLAALALGRIGDPTAVPSLIATLEDRNMFVRINVVIALGEIGHPDAIPGLAGRLNDGAWIPYVSKTVANFAAEALEQIATPEALAALQAWRQG